MFLFWLQKLSILFLLQQNAQAILEFKTSKIGCQNYNCKVVQHHVYKKPKRYLSPRPWHTHWGSGHFFCSVFSSFDSSSFLGYSVSGFVLSRDLNIPLASISIEHGTYYIVRVEILLLGQNQQNQIKRVATSHIKSKLLLEMHILNYSPRLKRVHSLRTDHSCIEN